MSILNKSWWTNLRAYIKAADSYQNLIDENAKLNAKVRFITSENRSLREFVKLRLAKPEGENMLRIYVAEFVFENKVSRVYAFTGIRIYIGESLVQMGSKVTDEEPFNGIPNWYSNSNMALEMVRTRYDAGMIGFLPVEEIQQIRIIDHLDIDLGPELLDVRQTPLEDDWEGAIAHWEEQE